MKQTTAQHTITSTLSACSAATGSSRRALAGKSLSLGETSSTSRIVVRSLFSWDPLLIDRTTLEGAWTLQDRYSLSWQDALIVSAAQITG